jgi:sigma-E factor negative regulatory protein RseB
VVVALLLASGPAAARDTARQWLDDMSSALTNLNYDGTFVYLHDGHMEAMRIIHRVDEAGQRERLVSLSGSAREVLRDDRTVTCILSDIRSVMVGQSRSSQPFPLLPEDIDSISRYYLLEDVGDDRMAGQLARVIAITPRDAYRYGYRFWIDKDSAMLLKSDLTGLDGQAIEQVMFTRLSVGTDIPEADLQPGMSGDGYDWTSQMNSSRQRQSPAGNPGWAVRQLPDGFALTNHQLRPVRKGRGNAEHMVFSDGLATVSVYIEDADKVAQPLVGFSGMGAMNAYGTETDGYQVTVVGEVPPATVEMIATSLARTSAHD